MSRKTAQENQQKKQQAQQQNQQTVQSGQTGVQRAAANNYTGSGAPLSYQEYAQARNAGMSQDDLQTFMGINGSAPLSYNQYRVGRELGISAEALAQYDAQVNAARSAALQRSQQQAEQTRLAQQMAVEPVPMPRAAQGIIAGAQGGEFLHAARQGVVDEANSRYRSALWDYLGNAAMQAQTGAMLPAQQQREMVQRQQDALSRAQQARQDVDRAGQAVQWEGRQELLDEHKRLRASLSYVDPEYMTPQEYDEQVRTYSRIREIEQQLEQGDIAAGNGQRVYSTGQGVSRFLSGTAKNLAADVGNALVTMGRAYGEAETMRQLRSPEQMLTDQLLGVDTMARAGEMEQIMQSPEYQEQWNRVYSVLDSLDEQSKKEIQSIKEGKGALNSALVDIGENVLQMGFDAGVGLMTGGGSLPSMFVRTFGSAARESRQAGGSQLQQMTYGAMKGGIEVLTEKIGGMGSRVYGTGWTDALTNNLIGRLAKTQIGANVLRVIAGMVEEGGEEVLSDLLDPLARAVSGMELQPYDMGEMMYDFLIGAVIGGLIGTGTALTGGYAQDNIEAAISAQGRQATQDWYRSGGWLTGRETQQEAGREAVFGQDYAERMQQMQVAMQPEQDYFGEETGERAAEGAGPYNQTAHGSQAGREMSGDELLQAARQTASQLQGEDLRRAQEAIGDYEDEIDSADELRRKMQRIAPEAWASATGEQGKTGGRAPSGESAAQTVAQEEEAKKQARTETMTGILQREATRQGMRNPGTQVLGEMAKVYEPGTSGQAYAKASLEAYQAGLDGQSYADARAQAQKAATLSAEQFRTAWQHGQKERTRQAKSETQEIQAAGQTEDVETMLAGLGDQAAEAAQAIEEGQDPGDYAAAMQEAVTVYAAAGADLRGAVAQARSGESESVLGVLTDSQVELAERLGQQRQTASREQARQRGEQRRTRSREQQIRQLQQQRQDLLSKQYGDELSDEEVDRQMEADSQEYERLSEQIRRLESGARVPGSTQRQEGRARYTDKAGSVDGARYVPVDQENLSKAQKATVKVAEAIARTTGLEIRLVRFTGNVGGAYLRGQGGVIYLDPTASYGGRSVAVGSFCHELTHWLQEYAPEEYQQLKEVVLREIGRNPAAFRDIFNERRRAQTDLSPDALTDEMVANACQTVLMDQEAVRRVAQENRTLFERIRDFILDMAEQFRAAFAEIDTAGDFPLYKEVRAAQGAMDEMRQLWLNAFDVASENLQAERAEGQNENAAQEGDGVQKMAWDAGETLESACDDMETISDEDYLKDKSAHPFVFALDHTPKKILDNVEGVKDRGFLIRRDALYLAVRANGVQEGHYHNLGAAGVKQIPAALENPDAILKTDNPNRFTVLTHINTSSGQAMISVEIESMKDYEGKHDYFNIILTMLDYRQRYLKQLFKNRSAVIKYENEALEQVNPQLHEWLRSVNPKASDDSIANGEEESKGESEEKAQKQAWSEGETYNDRALVSEETLDRWMDDYAASNPNYAQAYIAYMSPDRFLRMTTGGPGSRAAIEQQAEGLSVERTLDYSRRQPIQLLINSETGKVEGHEGRHRMVALRQAGITKVPVLMFDSRNKYSKQPMDSLTLTAQDFAQEGRDQTIVHDLLPLSRANRDAISQRFSKKQAVERIYERYGHKTAQFQGWEDTVETGANPIEIDRESGSANVQFSRWTWEHSDYVEEREEAASQLAEQLGISRKKALDYIDAVNSVAKMIAEEKGRLDYEDTGLSPFVGNAEYGGSFDFTTLRKKRRLLTGTFSAIQKALANTALTANEILEIRRMMDEQGLEVSCGKCYVEGSRAQMGIFTKEFIRLYKKYNPGAWAPNMAEMNTPDGIEWVRQNHPEVYEQYEYFWNHYGTLRKGDPNLFASQQKPKLYQMRSAYKGEVLKHFKRDGSIEEKNRNGGVRMQSFSDFEIVHLIDAMQVIMDMSRVGLAGQAYTKVPDFAWALGHTGLKINLSIDAWSVDENGRLVFNNKEGMNFEEAMRIRDANSENVGTICCVYDDAQLLAALADPRIDFIIPFHRSQWKKSQYKGMGLPATTKDYTYQQNEKWLRPKEHTHEYRGRQVPTKCTNYMPNEYWDFSKSGKENAEEYLRMCARDGKRPKFYKFLVNNGDGSFSLQPDGSTDGYWKLLIDFKMYDNDGKGAPQRPVRPDFNMTEVRRMLTSYEGGHNTFPVAHGVVDAFVEKYKAEHPGQSQFQTWDEQHNDWAPTFYSKMAETVSEWTNGKGQKLPPKMAAGQVVGWLKGKGVKSEEIRWSGIVPWLEGRKTVTQAELQQVMAENQIQIETAHLVDSGKEMFIGRYDYDDIELHSRDEVRKAAEQIADEQGFDPSLLEEHENSVWIWYRRADNDSVVIQFKKESEADRTHWKEYSLPGGSNYREILFKMPSLSGYTNRAMQVHWGERDVIAHARVQDMTGSGGRRVLFIEEIQSDLHNEGAKGGFESETSAAREERISKAKAKVDSLEGEYTAAMKESSDLAHELLDAWKESGSKDAGKATIATVRAWINGHGRFPTVPRTEENDLRADQMLDAMKVEDRLLGSWFLDPMWDQIVSIRNRVQAYDNAVQEYEVSQKRAANVAPDVPFAGESDTYHEYVMKHLLRMAAEGDYDTIAWTTAKMQSDRWSDEYTEGYRIEYDQKIPKFMRKYVKQWGADVSAIQVGEAEQEAWAVDLTLAMKDSVLNEGQPLFQRWDDPSDDSRAEARGRELGYARLQSENQVLTEAVQALQKLTGKQATTIARLQERLSLTKTPEVRDSDARKLARRLLQEYQSRADAESVQSQLKAIGDYLLQTRTDQLDQGRLKDMARGVAQEILADSYEQIGLEDEVPAHIKEDLKGRKISIDQDFLGELEGGYEAFRRSVFGTFTLAQRESRSREGREGYITVSQLYADLQGTYGTGILPDVANEGEELMVLRRVMQAAGIEVNPYRQYMGEAAEDMANRIVMDAMDGVLRPRPSTDMDRQQARQQALREQILELRQQQKLSDREAASLYHTIYDLTTALDKAQSRYTTLRTEAAYRQAQLLDEGRAREAERLARVRAQRDEKIAGLKTYYQDMIRRAQDKRTESAGVKKYRKQVAEKTAKLYELLMTNSDAKHVPQALKKPLAEFLESIDFSSKRLLEGGEETKADLKFGARLQALEQLLTNQQRALEGENVEPTDLGGYLDISEENLEYLREISQTVTQALSAGQTYTINQMTAQDLQNLSKLLSNLTKAIRGMNQFLANARFQSVREAASRDIETMGQLGKARETDHGGVSRFLTWENGIPYYIFKRFGEGGRAIFDGFARGWEKMAMNAKEIIDFTARTYKSEEVREWEKTIHDIELEDGSKIRMTTAQIMEFSMLLGREQAMKHIEAGGIRIGDIETKKGKISDTVHYHLTANDIDTLLNTLTDRQREVAKAMQAYMALRGAEWGNEVSMARFGYQFYEEGPGYYPIKTDSNDRPMADTDAQMNSMFRLLNLSASKTLNPKASNALVVGSIFDTFAEHMADMAKLNGMGLPILDAIKWFNYKERINRDDGTYDTRTLQAAMQEAYGEQAQKYFRTLMRDINGQTESGDRGMGAFGGFLSRYKIAAVGANLRVALLQPTSYVRAQTVIKPKYLLAAFTSRNAYKEAMEYSGTAVWKSLGYYDTDISKSMRSQIKHDETALDELTEKSMVLAEKGDQRTWGRLWVACKMQVKAEQKLEGEALKKATADLFREVIYSSQVMDGTLTRSEIMRAKGIQTKAASAFMAEPTLSYNIVLDAVSDIDQAGRRSGEKTFLGRFKAGWKAAGGKLGRAVITYVSSAAFSAIVESIADAVRDEDDDKFLDKFLEAFLGDDKKLRYSGNLLSDLTLIGKLPFYKEFVSMIQGFQSGNMGFEGFSNALNAYRIWKETYQLATGELEKPTKLTNYGKMTPWGKVYKTLQALSQLSGVPAANLTRDVVAIWNSTAGAIDPVWKIRRYDADALSQSKVNAWKRLLEPVGISQSYYKQALQEMNADGNSSRSQDEVGTWLTEQLRQGAISREQAEALWWASVSTSSKKSYSEWLEKQKK